MGGLVIVVFFQLDHNFHHVGFDHLQFSNLQRVLVIFGRGGLNQQHIFRVPIVVVQHTRMLFFVVKPDPAVFLRVRCTHEPVDVLKLHFLKGFTGFHSIDLFFFCFLLFLSFFVSH